MAEIKLQLGTFDQPVSSWFNTDITPHIFISRVPGLAFLLARFGVISSKRLEQHRAGVFAQIHYLNVAKPFPFKDNTVRCIYSSMMLEHLDRNVALGCLKDWYRVLNPGGILRLGFPIWTR